MPNLKALAFAALLALPIPTIAMAGPAETALLAKYAGEWRGTGQVTGPDPGTVVCRIAFRTTEAGRLTYSGRCSYSGQGAASFRGTLAYNDSSKRFEAVSSAQGTSMQSVGRKQGNSIVFASEGIETRYGTVSSTMTLGGSTIKMAFKLVDDGETTASSITLQRN
ncbi:MAG: hypothetical protein ACO1OG_06175 [Devosia sp.]